MCENLILCLLDVNKAKNPGISEHVIAQKCPQGKLCGRTGSYSGMLRQSELSGTNIPSYGLFHFLLHILVPTELGLVECFSLAMSFSRERA